MALGMPREVGRWSYLSGRPEPVRTSGRRREEAGCPWAAGDRPLFMPPFSGESLVTLRRNVIT